MNVIHAIISRFGESAGPAFTADDFRDLGSPEDISKAFLYLVKVRALRRIPWTLRVLYTPGPTFASLLRFVRRVTVRPRTAQAPLEEGVLLMGRLTVMVRDGTGRSRRGERVVIQGCGFV
jgi:hypothetical protein